MSVLGFITGGLGFIRELIGRPLREWSQWADENPGAAARHIEAIAVVLKARADAIAERRGNKPWRVRRDRHVSRAFFEYAEKLEAEASRREVHVRTAVCSDFERTCTEAVERAKKAVV